MIKSIALTVAVLFSALTVAQAETANEALAEADVALAQANAALENAEEVEAKAAKVLEEAAKTSAN